MTATTERATHVRMVIRENESYRVRRGHVEQWREIETLAHVAVALDEAMAAGIEKHGNSGLGAGAFLEALASDPEDNPEDFDGVAVHYLADPLFAHLPVGDLMEVRRFVARQSHQRVWDGNNRVEPPCPNSRELLERNGVRTR